MNRIAVITPEIVSRQMAGPAIRAWEMAKALASRGHDVRLLSTSSVSGSALDFDIRMIEGEPAHDELHWADVTVTHPGVLRTHPSIDDPSRPLVVDIYDPFHLENLEPGLAAPESRAANLVHLNSVVNDALVRGDYFLCASERQRDFWLGSLTTLGRVNPRTYDDDPTLASLIGIVPFGIDEEPPVHARTVLRGVVPGISDSDIVLLWAGGVYDWFDPVTLVEAVDIARREVQQIRLVFMGMGHPNPAVPEMRAASELRKRATDLELVGQHVFFNEGWVPYDDRANYLLEADIGVSTHLMHVETAFAFRTRVLDYLWAGLPTILSEGDVFASMSIEDGFGLTAPPGDVNALADAIVVLATDESRRRTCADRARVAASRFTWSQVLQPLLAFCDNPHLAADRADASPVAATATARPRRRWLRR